MQQWMRKCNLVVSANGDGLDLSQLRITFEVSKTENETPNHAKIKIFNLSKDTENQVIKEFTRVTLQAGYEDNFGVIFDGEIVQSKRGREGVDSYVQIDASDGDSAYNYAIVSKTLAAGSSQEDHVNACVDSMKIEKGKLVPNGTVKLTRGKVLHGSAKNIMRQSAKANKQKWNIQNGKLQLLGTFDLLPNQAVVLNSQTGLIGGAEQSTKGIKLKALINHMLHIGAKIVVNEGDIVRADKETPKAGSKTKPDKQATIASDGVYKIIGTEYTGDNRGTDWYVNITCIDVDESAPTKKAKG